MEKRRIPQGLQKFTDYLGTVKKYLSEIVPGTVITRGEYLGMTAEEVSQVADFHLLWLSGDPANPGAYELHTDPQKKSKLTRVKVVDIMRDFGKFFRPLLIRMSGSPYITSADRVELNISEPVTTRTRHKVPIKDKCNINFKMLGGGDVQTICRYKDDGRPGKPPLADAVEIAYIIDLPWVAIKENKVYPDGKPLYTLMKDPEEGTKKVISSKADFVLQLGTGNSGNHLQAMARWINIKNPQLNGPWSEAVESIIL